MKIILLLLFLTLSALSQIQLGEADGDNASQDAHGATYIVALRNSSAIVSAATIDSIVHVPRAGYADHWKLFFTATRSGNSWTIIDTIWVHETGGVGNVKSTFTLQTEKTINPAEYAGFYVPLLTADPYGLNGFRTRRDLSNTQAGDSVWAYTGSLGAEVSIIGNTITPADSAAYAVFEDFYEIEFWVTLNPTSSTSVVNKSIRLRRTDASSKQRF